MILGLWFWKQEGSELGVRVTGTETIQSLLWLSSLLILALDKGSLGGTYYS